MKKVESGKTVSVNYTGKFDNGEVFDSSLAEGREPLHTVLGHGSLIPGFEKGLLGMVEGEKKTLDIDPSEAYGEYLDGLVTTVPKERVPKESPLPYSASTFSVLFVLLTPTKSLSKISFSVASSMEEIILFIVG